MKIPSLPIIKNSERGSAIMVLFVAVALFGLLAFAFMQGTRSNIGFIDSESQRATQTQAGDCLNAVTMAAKRLEARGCRAMISYASDGSNANPGAPNDGSCSIYHVNGGGAKICEAYSGCSDDELAGISTIGDDCEGVVYAGVSGGNRIYTLAHEFVTRWNNGSGIPVIVGATSAADGLANTNILLAATTSSSFPYAGATTCRALGPEWYLPAINELNLLYSNRAAVGWDDPGGGDYYVYSSTQSPIDGHVGVIDFINGAAFNNGTGESIRMVKCVRR